MEGSAYPAPRRVVVSRKRAIIALALAALVGAALEFGAFVIFEDESSTTTTRVITSEPGTPGEVAKANAVQEKSAAAADLQKQASHSGSYDGAPTPPVTTPPVKDYSQNGATGDVAPIQPQTGSTYEPQGPGARPH
jgi:hypothetical protein